MFFSLNIKFIFYQGTALDALLRELRPDAVAIADAFDHSDYNLDSALGRRDGDVYRDLFDRVKDDPINRTDLPPGYDSTLKPVLAGGIWGRSSKL